MPDIKNKKEKNHIIRIRKMKSSKPAGVDTFKYCGTIKLKEDPLAIQKKLRNEWQ
jgi:hypothetical protein